MIIDIHAHTSNHTLYGLHTAQADLAQLEHYARQCQVDRIYLMATYFPLKKSGLSNHQLLARINGNRLFGCFGSLNLEADLPPQLAELAELARQGAIEGVKLYPGYQNVELADQRFTPLFKLAEEYRLPVACHMGELHHCCPKGERERSSYRCGANHCPLDLRGTLSSPAQLRPVAERHPQVNFLASHYANPFFAELRGVMAECPNVYTDISGQFVSGTDEDSKEYRHLLAGELKALIDQDGGVERLLFGTDFPIQSYRDSLDLVRMLELDAARENMVLSGNAKRLLGADR